jgi:RNA polymerase sigma factor (TIGR02999 family)
MCTLSPATRRAQIERHRTTSNGPMHASRAPDSFTVHPPEASMPSTGHPSEPVPSGDATAGEVTLLLQEARTGGRAALDRVLPLLYDDLRRLARRQLARERGARVIQPTTLVHEAYLKLAGNPPRAADRAHLLAIAAHSMRQVLVDQARERHAKKRGPGWIATTLTDGVRSADLDPAALIALDDALARLEPRLREVVECRFFGGLDDDEIAEALGVSARTVRRDWVKARAWLNSWLG